MSTATLDKTEVAPAATVTIHDGPGKSTVLTHIEGMTLEEYFAQAGVTMTEGRAAVSNNRRLTPTDTLAPNTSVELAGQIMNG